MNNKEPMKKFIIPLIFLSLTFQSYSQNLKINKIEPPNWWSNMKYDEVQFMIYGKNLNNLIVLGDLSELKVDKIYNADKSDYCFIDVKIPKIDRNTSYKIFLTNHFDTVMIEIPVFVREDCQNCYRGFNQDDIIYLITPDRFCNGDETNDSNFNYVPDYTFGSEMGRHGGDIKGIIDHLDYIKETGFTAIWINPVLENNSVMSYHGYAATDLYKIDERFGTNELYKNLVKTAHQKDLKVIFDHINNHIGINHPWVDNPPYNDWFNGSKSNHFITPHEKMSLYSSYSSELTIDSTIEGWFVEEMPDLNQRNSFVANYLIQNMLWWIEYTGLDGIREDTYPYSDQKFLSEWNIAILDEYPKFNITGEAWIEDPAFLAPYQKSSKFNSKINTNLPSLIDFGLYRAIRNLIKPNGSVTDLYKTLAKDFLYSNPNNLLTFADNHDIERLMYAANNDISQFKLALTFLLTTRGIPQIYYGTEIGMIGGKSHGQLREEFPGGFSEHKRSAFIRDRRTENENEIYDFIKNLLSLRKYYSSLRTGELIHFPPKDELYVYFKISNAENILVVLNNGSDEKKLDLKSYKSIVGNNPSVVDLLAKQRFEKIGDMIEIGPKSSNIFLIK
jgi:neopullulanase